VEDKRFLLLKHLLNVGSYFISSALYVSRVSLIGRHDHRVSVMPWVKERLRIGQERGRLRSSKDDFEYFDLTTYATP
jgi:hypothetical protein